MWLLFQNDTLSWTWKLEIKLIFYYVWKCEAKKLSRFLLICLDVNFSKKKKWKRSIRMRMKTQRSCLIELWEGKFSLTRAISGLKVRKALKIFCVSEISFEKFKRFWSRKKLVERKIFKGNFWSEVTKCNEVEHKKLFNESSSSDATIVWWNEDKS